VKPDLSFVTVLWPGALGIALMSFTETVAAGRAFLRNDEPAPRADRELLATGLANVGGALFGAMPGGGGTTQTAVNFRAGARTQLAEMVTAAMALVSLTLDQFDETARHSPKQDFASASRAVFINGSRHLAEKPARRKLTSNIHSSHDLNWPEAKRFRVKLANRH
jgi:Sulfate permease family